MHNRAHKIKVAAKRLSLSERKTQQLITTGELGSIKIGRSRRVTDDQIAAFLAAKERQTAESAAAA